MADLLLPQPPHAASDLPAAVPLQMTSSPLLPAALAALAPPEAAPTLFREFAQWLQSWADRVQAQLVQQEVAAKSSQRLAPGPVDKATEPMPSQEEAREPLVARLSPELPAKPGGPPAHWLERVKRAEPPAHWQAHIQRVQSEDGQAFTASTIGVAARESVDADPSLPDGVNDATAEPQPKAETAPDTRVAEQGQAASAPSRVNWPVPPSHATAPITLATMSHWITELRQGVAIFLQAQDADNLVAQPATPVSVTSPAATAQPAAMPAEAVSVAYAVELIERAAAQMAMVPQREATTLPVATLTTAPQPAANTPPTTQSRALSPAPAPSLTVVPTLRQTQLRVSLAPASAAKAVPVVDTAPKLNMPEAPPQVWPALPEAQPAIPVARARESTPPAARPSADLWPDLPPVSTAELPMPLPHHRPESIAPNSGDRPASTRQTTQPVRLAHEQWPILLDETQPSAPSAPLDWRHFAYQQARRQRLDREQQGTLWNG